MSINLKPTGVISVSLEAGPEAAADARALVDELELGLDPVAWYDLRLALTELVNNSVQHGSQQADDRIDVQFTRAERVLRCEVADTGPGFLPARPGARGAAATVSGFGLVIVDRVATRWGVRRGGRSVWFELELAM